VQAIADSGASGVMVGRSLVGRPWDISEIRAAVDGHPDQSVSALEKAKVAVEALEQAFLQLVEAA